MPHGVVIALELVGAVLILAGYTLGQLRLLDQHAPAYLVLNLVGSFVLAVIALVDARWGFLLLEGVWSRRGAAPRYTLNLMWSTSPSRTT